jgi:pimeloyl-ACP methyl ester carboxylesterase
MKRVVIHSVEGTLRLKNRLIGVGEHKEPFRHFGAGGVAEAEALCDEASRDLLAFVRPPEHAPAATLTIASVRKGRPGSRSLEIRFDSPRPSGHAANDRVVARLIPAAQPRSDRKALVFHHALFQRYWGLWEWFLAPFARRFPVVMMAAPFHFERRPDGWFAGEGTVNPNPWRLYESIRQWSWDQQALMRALPDACGVDPVAVVGFSLGAFQSLLVAAADDRWTMPLVSVAATNRYAFGLRHGMLGRGTLNGLRRAGIDGDRLDRMVDAIQLERYVPRLRGRPVLYVAGRHDLVDPPPSPHRLEAALAPTRSVWLNSGHGTVVLERASIAAEVFRFLDQHGIG